MTCLRINYFLEESELYICIPYSELRCIEHQTPPRFITIYYMDQSIQGIADKHFEICDVINSWRNNEYRNINITSLDKINAEDHKELKK